MVVEKTRCNGTWTESQYWSFIRSGLRRMWLRYPVRTQCLLAGRRDYVGDNKRQKYEYQCNMCYNWYKATEVQVDHIKPAGSLLEPTDIASFVTTLFCEPDNTQRLCKPCHKIKTGSDRDAK